MKLLIRILVTALLVMAIAYLMKGVVDYSLPLVNNEKEKEKFKSIKLTAIKRNQREAEKYDEFEERKIIHGKFNYNREKTNQANAKKNNSVLVSKSSKSIIV